MVDKVDLVLIKPGNQKKLYGSLSSSLSGIEPPVLAGLIVNYIRQQGYSVLMIDAEAENLDEVLNDHDNGRCDWDIPR